MTWIDDGGYYSYHTFQLYPLLQFCNYKLQPQLNELTGTEGREEKNGK